MTVQRNTSLNQRLGTVFELLENSPRTDYREAIEKVAVDVALLEDARYLAEHSAISAYGTVLAISAVWQMFDDTPPPPPFRCYFDDAKEALCFAARVYTAHGVECEITKDVGRLWKLTCQCKRRTRMVPRPNSAGVVTNGQNANPRGIVVGGRHKSAKAVSSLTKVAHPRPLC